MTIPSYLIYQLLLDEALAVEGSESAEGYEAPWGMHVGFMPGAPDNAIGIMDTAGTKDGRLLGSGKTITHPGIQVRVRSNEYNEAWVRIYAIKNLFDTIKRRTITVDGVPYVLVNASVQGDIIPLGLETEGDRRTYSFTLNAILTVEGF